MEKDELRDIPVG
jgi:hypothetical protein